MATTPRNKLKGKSIVFTIGGTDYTMDASTVKLTSADSDDKDQSFADAAAGGGVDWTLSVSAFQSTDATSLQNYIRSNPGAQIAFAFGPNGGTTASVTQPQITGTVTIPAAGQTFGGDVNSTWSFDMDFPVVGAPVWKTA